MYRLGNGGQSPHCNKQRFVGTLALLDEPSDKGCAGSRGHRVELTAEAAHAAINSLIGMGVNADATMTGHDVKRILGVIEQAWIEDKELRVSGYLFRLNHPSEVESIAASAVELGMSYEIHDAVVEDLRARVWRVLKCEFTGAAVLERQKCAYLKSKFELAKEDGCVSLG